MVDFQRDYFALGFGKTGLEADLFIEQTRYAYFEIFPEKADALDLVLQRSGVRQFAYLDLELQLYSQVGIRHFSLPNNVLLSVFSHNQSAAADIIRNVGERTGTKFELQDKTLVTYQGIFLAMRAELHRSQKSARNATARDADK